MDLQLQLQHKAAVVTGSTAGIGLAIASLLASEGANVVVNGIGQKGPRSKKWRSTATERRGYDSVSPNEFVWL